VTFGLLMLAAVPGLGTWLPALLQAIATDAASHKSVA
jgi:hypothetical protein